MTYGATAVAKTNQSLAAPGVMNGMNQVWRSLRSPSAAADDNRWAYHGMHYAVREDIGRLFESAVPEKPEATEEEGRQWRRLITLQRALATGLVAIVVFVGGTSLAFAHPESSLAAPFRGVAEMLSQMTTVATEVIGDTRGVAAGYERQTISTAMQVMRVVAGLATVAPVTSPTNDMANFPSAENALYPDFLDRRYSQFSYTVSADGNVTADSSVATTDAFLEGVLGLLDELPTE